MNYTFFFDESFHDRNINFNEESEILNIYKTGSHQLDSYVGVFFGFPTDSLCEVERKLIEFEEKYKFHFNLAPEQEFKSINIKAKNFKFGLRSFEKNIFRFYKEYFELIESLKPLIFVDTISKTELALRSIFSNLELPKYIIYNENEIMVSVNKNLFFYSLTKFFITYHTKKLQEMLFDPEISNNPALLKKELLKTLNIIIDRNKQNPRKKIEIQNYKQMINILELSSFNNIQINKNISFCYKPNFQQFEQFINKNNIKSNDVNLVIDEEENTFLDSIQFNFRNIEQKNSSNCIFLHLSDFLANFIGRFIYALHNDKSFIEDNIFNIEDIYNNNLEKKRVISSEWFNLTEDRFLLYKKINKILYHAHSLIPYSTYGDQEITFFTFLNYINDFDWENFKNISNKNLHSDGFNLYLIQILSIYYKIKGDRYSGL